MSSPDLVAPDRLEDLLGGHYPETDLEARLQRLVVELRSAPRPAPEALRERVRSLATARPARSRFSGRRLALVLAAACVAATAAVLLLPSPRVTGSSGGEESARHLTPQEFGRSSLTPPSAVDTGAPLTGNLSGAADRARDIDMWIELRLPDADRLSEAVSSATAITRELGGFVASSSVRSAGNEGRAELALRVPVGNVDDAAARLSQLGTITGQRVVTEDLQADIDRAARRIVELSRAIRIAQHRLESGTLGAEQRLRVEIRLEHLRAERADLRNARARLAARAATAELTLVLHTREAAAAAKEESRIGGAAADAANFLGRAGAVAVFAAIVLSPILLLLVLAWFGLRARARRIETHVLEQTRPAATTVEPRS